MKVKIFLFRHSESEDNRQHIFSGWRNPNLSEKGRIDSQELSELLKDKIIDIFYTPELTRNIDTVKEITRYHQKAKIIIDNRIKERSYGDLQGKKHLELMKEDLRIYLTYHRSYEVPPPNGESIRMVEERVAPFYDDLIKLAKGEHKNIGVCGGNNALRTLRRRFENLTVEQMMKIENPFDNYFEYEVEVD